MREPRRATRTGAVVARCRHSLVMLVAVCVGLPGCVATIDEHHHIATFGEPTPLNPTGFANVLRVTIDGNAEFTNVRYIAGNYDEYAADLFLNNVKSSPYESSVGAKQGANKIFNLCIPAKEEAKSDSGTADGDGDGDGKDTDKDKEQCRDNANGDTFLIIMSTNADAISETIGAFAENQNTIKSLNYLLNKDVFDQQQVTSAMEPLVSSERSAMLATLDALFEGYDESGEASDARDMAILQTIAVALEPEGDTSFTTLEEAKAWFANLD